MTLSHAAQATLLLTSYFSKSEKGTAKPLSPTEWGRFAQWLHDQGRTPADLFQCQGEGKDALYGWQDSKIPVERLMSLLGRGSSMALAMEKWQRAGLWVMTRSDTEYPRQLKRRLKHAAPPVLFGCGNKGLLNSGGVAVVGSRKAGESDLAFAQQLGSKAAQSAVGVVSGGARGIDEAAMLGALADGGPVIGILSDGLLKAATSAKWRQGLTQGNMVLISPYYPEAGFNVGNAMGRNKYIYCLAESAVVVHSGATGGTMAGAQENLRQGWVPLWVKPTPDPEAGNQLLVDQGGAWCQQEAETLDVQTLFQLPQQPESDKPAGSDSESIAEPQKYRSESSSEDTGQLPQADLFSEPDSGHAPVTEPAAPEQTPEIQPSAQPSADVSANNAAHDEPDVQPSEARVQTGAIDFYQLFLGELQRLATSPITPDEIIAQTGLHKTQVNSWLKQALEENKVEKKLRPVRYRSLAADASQAPD